MNMTWEQAAKEVQSYTYVDWVDRFIVCPLTQKMISEYDYPEMNCWLCPLCEWELNLRG
jgi:uncharacterized CHY-type Zn-finger protein